MGLGSRLGLGSEDLVHISDSYSRYSQFSSVYTLFKTKFLRGLLRN